MFKSDITDTNKKGELVAWFSASNIDYIKNLRKATYNTDYIFNLSFLNISFIITSIQTNIYYVLDHKVQVTMILGRGKVPLEQMHYYILKTELSTFSAFI
jgi:hypothetical protein